MPIKMAEYITLLDYDPTKKLLIKLVSEEDLRRITKGIFGEDIRTYLFWWKDISIKNYDIKITIDTKKNLKYIIRELNTIFEKLEDFSLTTSDNKKILKRKIDLDYIDAVDMISIFSGLILRKDGLQVMFKF